MKVALSMIKFKDSYGVLALLTLKNGGKQQWQEGRILAKFDVDFNGHSHPNEKINNSFWETYRLKYYCST